MLVVFPLTWYAYDRNINDIMSYYVQNKLNIYLAPFLHGTRYTSYGRHFTKLDKLEKVDLHII